MPLVNFGATLGPGTVVLGLLLGPVTHLLRHVAVTACCRGFSPRCIPRFRTPYLSTILIGVVAAVLSAFLPENLLIELVAIGTLAAFVLVCLSVIILRKTHPDVPRPFRTPLVPIVPIGGMLVCFGMMAGLPLGHLDTLYRLGTDGTGGLFLLCPQTCTHPVLRLEAGLRRT